MTAWIAAMVSVMGAMTSRPPPAPRIDFASRISELQRANYDAMYAGMLAQYQNPAPPKLVLRPSKCPSCGSREFREHRGQTVCSYCRGGA